LIGPGQGDESKESALKIDYFSGLDIVNFKKGNEIQRAARGGGVRPKAVLNTKPVCQLQDDRKVLSRIAWREDTDHLAMEAW